MTIEESVNDLDNRMSDVERRIEDLGFLSELAVLIHGCLGDLFDAVEGLGAEVPSDLDERLDRLGLLARLIF